MNLCSRQTALIKAHNDIDRGHSVILVLLDLSAAFDLLGDDTQCRSI